MKRAVICGERQAKLVDTPDPQPKENWALVKVDTIPMCTEYKAFVAGREAQYLGHEAVGEVVEVARPCRVKPGDRVVVQPQYPCGKCNLCIAGDYIHCREGEGLKSFTGGPEGGATYAQYVLKPDWLLSPIPDDVSYELAGLAICGLGPSMGAFEAMGLSAYDTVLITGLGPVGLGGVVNAQFRGARIIAVDSVPYRQQKAKDLGAEFVLDPSDENLVENIRDLTNGRGVDCSLDCAGSTAAQRVCLDATRRRGQVAYVGQCGDDLAIRVSPDLISAGLTVHGVWHYNLNLYPKIVKVLQQSPVVGGLISHILPFSDIQGAFEQCASRENAKVLMKAWE